MLVQISTDEIMIHVKEQLSYLPEPIRHEALNVVEDSMVNHEEDLVSELTQYAVSKCVGNVKNTFIPLTSLAQILGGNQND